MNVATEEDVASHFDNVILNPPFEPNVKPSEGDAMAFIESMMAESETAFGVAPTPAKVMITPLQDTVERLGPLLRLPAERLDTLTLTPIHLETERLINAASPSQGINLSSLCTPPVVRKRAQIRVR